MNHRRAYTDGRIVPLTATTARAVVAYLRARRSHRLAGTPALWLGTRTRAAMTGSGLYQMLQRRADQAGYDPDVHPHRRCERDLGRRNVRLPALGVPPTA